MATITNYLSSFRTNNINGIKSSLMEESTYRQLFARRPEDVNVSQITLLHQPYLNLINVYENEDIWKIKNRYFNNESGHDNDMYIMPLPEEKRLKHDVPAIHLGGIRTFQANWNIFSEMSLLGLDWSNMFAAGGAVLACILPIPAEYDVGLRKRREWFHDTAYKSSDIDLFIYGLDEEAAKQKMIEIYEVVRNNVSSNVACFRSKHCVTISSQYPNRHIQIVLRLYNSPSEILTGFDVDCCSVGFDGKNVWALPRAHQAIIRQFNTVDLTRRSPSYEIRLIKYAERGFEIKVPSLEISRIDPTIYERSFEKLHGLARLLVLERFKNTPDHKLKYIEKKYERSYRPKDPNSTTPQNQYSSRIWQRRNDLKVHGFENSYYETVNLPYGPKFNANTIMKWVYAKDMVLNSKKSNRNNKHRVLHRHLCFFSPDIRKVFGDCCGFCPVPSTPEEIATQIEEDKIYIRGNIEFIKDDPGRQTIGSFHPLVDDDWTAEAYITNARVDLCIACANGAVNIVENLLNQKSLSTANEKVDVNKRDYLWRTPLQLAVLGGHTETVKKLLQHNAKITAKTSDGNTVVHLASQYGFLDILELLLQKSDENKKKVQGREHEKSSLEANNQTQTQQETSNNDMEVDDSFDQNDQMKTHQDSNSDDMVINELFEMVNKMKIDHKTSSAPKVLYPDLDEKKQDDIINLNDESQDYPLAPLDYAILFGQVEIVKLLVKAGANVQRPIKLRLSNAAKVYYPLGLCMLTQNQNIGMEIATILLENGATVFQLDYEHNNILHLAVKAGKTQFVKFLFDVNPRSLRIINSVNAAYQSPLYLSAADNRLEMTELLISHGARANIELEDIQEFIKHRKHQKYPTNPEDQLNNVQQPMFGALLNNQYRILIEAGADVNSHSRYTGSARDRLEDLISQNKYNIEEYKNKYQIGIKRNLQNLNELLEEKKRVEKGTYREYALNQNTVEVYYDFLYRKNPRLYPYRQSYVLRKHYDYEKKSTKLIETETKKLNYNKECLEYLINHGAKSLYDDNDDYDLILEDDTSEPLTEITEINFDEFIMKFRYLDYNRNVPTELVPEYVKLFQAVYVNDISIVERMSQSLVLAVRDNFSMTPFMLACFRGHSELAVRILDTVASQYASITENMIVEPSGGYSDYVPDYDLEGYPDDVTDYNSDGYPDVTNYDSDGVPDYDSDCFEGSEGNIVEEFSTISTMNTPNFLNVKPTSKYSVCEFLMYEKSFKSMEPVPKVFFKKHKQKLNGFEVAVLKNDLETVKRILGWAEKYQYVGDISEKDGGLVTYLIQRNRIKKVKRSVYRNPMIDSIHFGYVDIIDTFIEYAAGGNNFSIFDIEDPEEENRFKIPKYYQGLDVDGSKKRSWMVQNNPNAFDKHVEPSYLFYAAYYGNIASIQYFFSERPIKALERYARKYTNNNSKDLRVTILNTMEDIHMVGKKLFTCELFRNETPFHWAVQKNEYDAINELARLYKDKEQAGDGEEQQLTLEEILDMRADNKKVTALLLAAQFGYNKCIRALLKAGADPGITDCNSWSLAHYAANEDKIKTIELLHKLLQPETYQRMLEQRSKSFSHTPISISILNSNVKLTECLLQQVTTANLFTYDFENNQYLHLALREGLWGISKKLIELGTSRTTEVDERIEYLHRENSFGQTPTEIAIQMFLNTLVSVPVFKSPPDQLPPELAFNQPARVKREVEGKCAKKAFNLMVPFYLPRNQGNLSSKRVLVEFNTVNNMVHKLAEKISDGLGDKINSKETDTKIRLKTKLISFKK